MRKPVTKTTKAVFFAIDKNKVLKSYEITINGRFTEEEVESFLKSEYTGESSDKFYLLLDIV